MPHDAENHMEKSPEYHRNKQIGPANHQQSENDKDEIFKERIIDTIIIND